MSASPSTPPFIVRASPVHGLGVFALRKIAAGSRILPYRGQRIDWDEARRRAQLADGPRHHTFLFCLSNGMLVDGGRHGNAARWINHSCAPNCEAIEIKLRIYIHALRDIRRGEELLLSYPLLVEGRKTAALKRAFACHCGAPTCRGTLLAD